MDRRELPIGFFDSGIGGISVLREAIRILPNEDFIYFGDSKNAPYGTKSPEEIKRLTIQAVDKLIKMGVKALVVACNTATAAAINELRETYTDIPVIGIEPAIKPAVICNEGGRIIVLATPATVSQSKLIDLIDTYKDEADIVSLGCKGLMDFVENGVFDEETLFDYFDDNLGPYLDMNTESIVLGCTHYPFLKEQLKHYLDKFFVDHPVRLIDGSKGTSSQLKKRLEQENLLREPKDKCGEVRILNSSDDPQIIERCKALLSISTGE